MKMSKWDPFKDMMLVHEFFDPMNLANDKDKACSWTPAVDVYETEGQIVLTAELPGIRQEDMELTVLDNALSLKGERRFERDVMEDGYHIVERNYGRFHRRFTMPCEVHGDKITASFKDGVLKVVIPKKTSVKKINVEIK